MAWLDVRVPDQSVVHIDNLRMTSTGESRRYGWTISQPGKSVTCTVRVELDRDGKRMEATKKVDLRAGAVSTLAFEFTNLETSLSVQVPPDADVFLANKKKEGTGAVRTFTTTKLGVGQTVSDYPVRVSVVRNGRMISQEQRISLTSGEFKKLKFEFDENPPFANVR